MNFLKQANVQVKRIFLNRKMSKVIKIFFNRQMSEVISIFLRDLFFDRFGIFDIDALSSFLNSVVCAKHFLQLGRYNITTVIVRILS